MIFADKQRLPGAVCPAVKTARIEPFRNDRGQTVVYDMYIGGRWHGSCRELWDAKMRMNELLKRAIHDWTIARKHPSEGVSQDATKAEYDESAF